MNERPVKPNASKFHLFFHKKRVNVSVNCVNKRKKSKVPPMIPSMEIDPITLVITKLITKNITSDFVATEAITIEKMVTATRETKRFLSLLYLKISHPSPVMNETSPTIKNISNNIVGNSNRPDTVNSENEIKNNV